MRIPAGGSNVCMPQQLLHLVQTPARIDQKRSKTVPKVRDPEVWQASPDSRCVPAKKERNIRLSRFWVGKNGGINGNCDLCADFRGWGFSCVFKKEAVA